MASATTHWTGELPPLAACGLLPMLPSLPKLRERADAAVRLSAGSHPSASTSNSNSASASDAPGAELLFQSRQLFEAVRRCVDEEPDLPPAARPAAALLLASVAMEDYVRSHSTKARLVAAQHASIARAAATAAAAQLCWRPDPRSSAASGPHGSGGGNTNSNNNSSNNSDAELLAFLKRSGRDQIVDRLLAVLGEPHSARPNLERVVAKHGAVDLAAILKATKRAFDTGDTQRTDGSGSRTLGGVFFRESKRYKASVERSHLQQHLPPPPPLRAHQRRVVGMALASWGLTLTEEVLGQEEEEEEEEEDGGGGGGEGEALRRRRLAAHYLALAGGWGGNWLVSSPTNSGKTRMFIEVARGVISSPRPGGRGAIVLVLVPSVILTAQHAAAFDEAQLPRTLTGAYSSDNPLTSRIWSGLCAAAAGGGGHHSVVVATAASFLNLLQAGKALMGQVDLMVLDEAHHCKDDHPYAAIMENFYKPAQQQHQQRQQRMLLAAATGNGRASSAAAAPGLPRVFAVTASPASEKDKATLDRRMSELLERLGPARLHLVDCEEPGVAAVLPEPAQLTARVGRRGVDRELMIHLQNFALDAALEIDDSLHHSHAEGEATQLDRQQLSQALHASITACEEASAAGQPLVTRLDTLGQWLSKARLFAARYGCPNLDLNCRLMDVVRKTVELVEDAGFEGALPFLARKAAGLCRDELAVNGGAAGIGAGAGRVPTVPPCPPAGEARRAASVAAVEAAAAMEATAAAAAANDSAAGVRARMRARTRLPGVGGGGGGMPAVLASLAGAAAAMPSAHELGAQLEAARLADGAAPPGNSCADIPLRVSKLLNDLLVGEDSVLSLPEVVGLLPECFVSGELQEASTFPKFWELVKFLQRYREREEFHGIIFVRTRQAVFHVTDMIHRTAQLQFLEVLELIGQNHTTKRTALAPEEDRHGRGMSDSQQQQVLRLFKEPGRKVLVATSTAEEGLDVPSCEFVVRYNAAATGIQLLQSRGRARQRVAEFCSILQDGTLDTDLHAKSRQEEANMHEWQRAVAVANRGSVLL